MEEWNDITPLKVMMTTDTIGGVWSYSIELCKALKEYNVHFHLITTGALLQPSQKADLNELTNVTVYQTEFMLEWMESPWQNIEESGRWLLQLADRIQPNLVHLNTFAYSALPWKVPVTVVAHSDVFSWWLAVKQTYPAENWNEYFKRVFMGLQQADFIVAPSRATLSQVRKLYYATAPGKVIYNGRSSESFAPGQKQAVICSVGRIWDEGKNIRLLVEASRQIPYKIRLAGDVTFQRAGRKIDAPNITMLGKISMKEVASELANAAVYVLPAKYEPFGLSVLEAALSGCALVLGKINSLKEIWGDSALYVDTSNPARLARIVNKLMENEDYRVQFARKAFERAKTYSTSAMAANYMEVYRSLLTNKHELINDK